MNSQVPNERRKPGLKTRRSFVALSFSAFIFLGAILGIYGSVSNAPSLNANTTDTSGTNGSVYSNTVDTSQDPTSISNREGQSNNVRETRVSTKSSGS